MKKLVSAAILGGLLAGLAACNSSAPSGTDSAASTNEAHPAGSVLLDFNLQTQKLPTMAGVGQFEDGKGLASTGTPGILMYGPYSAVAAGKYKVTVNGSFDGTQPANPLTIDITYGQGSSTPKSVQVAPADVTADGKLASFEFTLPEKVSDLEVRARVVDGTHVLIKGYQVVVE